MLIVDIATAGTFLISHILQISLLLLYPVQYLSMHSSNCECCHVDVTRLQSSAWSYMTAPENVQFLKRGVWKHANKEEDHGFCFVVGLQARSRLSFWKCGLSNMKDCSGTSQEGKWCRSKDGLSVIYRLALSSLTWLKNTWERGQHSTHQCLGFCTVFCPLRKASYFLS